MADTSKSSPRAAASLAKRVAAVRLAALPMSAQASVEMRDCRAASGTLGHSLIHTAVEKCEGGSWLSAPQWKFKYVQVQITT